MEIDNVFYSFLPSVMKVANQSFHLAMYVFGRTCILSSHFIGQTAWLIYTSSSSIGKFFLDFYCKDTKFCRYRQVFPSKVLARWELFILNYRICIIEIVPCVRPFGLSVRSGRTESPKPSDWWFALMKRMALNRIRNIYWSITNPYWTITNPYWTITNQYCKITLTS